MRPHLSRPCFALTCAAVLLASVFAPAVEAQQPLQPPRGCFTPPQWKPKLGTQWNRDANNNNVEDDIEKIAPDAAINVILDLNQCPSAADLSRFGAFGQVGFVGRFLSVVQLRGVKVSDALLLAQDPRVAMVELERPVTPSLDISTQAIRVRSGFYSPNTVQDACPLDGTGVTIAIIDTGVDDQTVASTPHEGFPPGKFLGGFICTAGNGSCISANPDDSQVSVGHGTHVAGIALGTGGTSPYRGVAPGARLVDIQVFVPSGAGSPADVMAGLEKTIDNKILWNIGVVNLSLGLSCGPGCCVTSNGLDSMSQYVNVVVSNGMVVVVAAGNCGPTPGTIAIPATAAYALTVGATSDQGTPTRSDDVVGAFSSRGPLPGGAQKPDVVAPGTDGGLGTPPDGGPGIMSADYNTVSGYVRHQGTSMAAPHVAGLAALILQSSPPNTHPLAVKAAVIQRAAAFSASPNADTPGWDRDFGNGLVDGFICNTPPPPGGTISGTAFYDLDCDGTRDPGDMGLSGWTIFVTTAGNIVSTALTDAAGNYTVGVYPPGTYTVSAVPQSGWLPQAGSQSVTVTANQHVQHIDFGNCLQPCANSPTAATLDISTGKAVTNPSAPLGQRDSDWLVVNDPYPANSCLTPFPPTNPPPGCPGAQTTEPRPAYVLPNFYWAGPFPGSQWIGARLQDSIAGPTCNGCYHYQRCFCLDAGFQNARLSGDLLADDEAVIFLNGTQLATVPATCHFNPGSQCHFDTSSQALFQEGLNCITVEVKNEGEGVTGMDITGSVTADQGLFTDRCCGSGCIFGVKWDDQNANRVRDLAVAFSITGDLGLQSWPINLSGGSTTPPPTTTDLYGDYSFCGLLPGTYTVSESLMSGWAQTFPYPNQSHTVNLQAGQQFTDIDFGNHTPVPGKGTVIINKIAGAGHATFSYTGTLGSFVIPTTGGNGQIVFPNIAPGLYTVTELGPPFGSPFTSLVCTDPDGGTAVNGQTATIDLDAGEVVTCTYANSTRNFALDHFTCYKVRETRNQCNTTLPTVISCKNDRMCPPGARPCLGFPQHGITVHLQDQFEEADADVSAPRHLCAPTDKQAEGMTDPQTHLKAYLLKGPHVPQKALIENQFGKVIVQTIKPERLLVPTAKSLTGPVSPPAPNARDHYECYSVKQLKACEGDGQACQTDADCEAGPCLRGFPGVGVRISNQFETSGIGLLEVKELCTPVNKNGEGINNPAEHLLCYQTDRDTVNPGPYYVNNQLGPERLTVGQRELFCVPSSKTLLPGPRCGNGRLDPGEGCDGPHHPCPDASFVCNEFCQCALGGPQIP
jgi:serine protease AprX